MPTPTQLPGDPFFVKKSWPIGGSGNWDYLTLDPVARRLYIAHGHAVQVVDVDSGSVVGEITRIPRCARHRARRYRNLRLCQRWAGRCGNRSSTASTLKAEATIQIGCSPRFIAFEPQSKLVFAFCSPGSSSAAAPKPRPGERPCPAGQSRPGRTSSPSTLQKNTVLADITLNGDFRIAQADGSGSSVCHGGNARPLIAQFDATGIAAAVS